MNIKEIEILIGKYFTNQISSEELDVLNLWLENKMNHAVFQQYVEINYSIEQLKSVNLIDKGRMWKSIKSQIKSENTKVIKWKYVAAVAASVVILFSITFLLNKNSNKTEDHFVNTNTKFNNDIQIGTDKALLTLENGSTIQLERGLNYKGNNLKSDGERLIYFSNSNINSEITYNYLTVPRGGQYYLKLSDGTQIFLNSESKLKYPVDFEKGKTREVELLYGEAYFVVSPSTLHGDTKFTVKNKLQDIVVLGTVFNVKAYQDEDAVYTTLIEGKVSIDNFSSQMILKPGEMSRTSISDKVIKVMNVDVYNEISWKDGLFSFKSKSLKEIMTVLSRWYDINIEFSNPELEAIEFKGVLSKDQNIEEILMIIKNLNYINNYEINKKTIIIK